LMLTGLDDVDAIAQAFEAGATDFATKPIPWQVLAHRARYMLRAKRASEALRHSEARLVSAQRIARLGHWEHDLATDEFRWSERSRTSASGRKPRNGRCSSRTTTPSPLSRTDGSWSSISAWPSRERDARIESWRRFFSTSTASSGSTTRSDTPRAIGFFRRSPSGFTTASARAIRSFARQTRLR